MTRTNITRLLSIFFLVMFGACRAAPELSPPSNESSIRLSDATGRTRVQFTHRHGGYGKKYLIETMGAGVCVIDYDGNDRPDLFLVQSAPLPDAPPDPLLHSSLYRNNGDGTFTEVTHEAGVPNLNRYGMGCAVADIDNDGDSDLYVTNFGPNSLYRNEGDGTFSEVGGPAGVASELWGASAAFADYDLDGYLDLFVTNYLDFTLAKHTRCGDAARKLNSYCHPDAYDGIENILYRNQGDGTFTDVTREAGLWSKAGKGLGVIWTDYDIDGDPDLYVANDSVPNFFYRNNGDGTFTDVTLPTGTGYSEEGRPEAGMGIAAGDVDSDGKIDLFVTNLSNEVNALYRNNGDGTFSISTHPSGLGESSLLCVGFGTELFDADNDGDLDLYVTNGHVMDDIEAYSDAITFHQADFIYENLGGGKFREVGDSAGVFFKEKGVGRAVTVLDYDGDGRLDLALLRNQGRARILRNETPSTNHWLAVELQGTRSNRDGIGAFLTLTMGDTLQVAERRGGSSYLSAREGLVHFGLGELSKPGPLEVHWPSGLVEIFDNLPVDQRVTLVEGAGSTPGGERPEQQP